MSSVQAIAVVMIRFWAIGWLITYLLMLSQSLGLYLARPDESVPPLYVATLHIAYFFIVAFWGAVLFWSERVTLWVLPPVKEPAPDLRFAPEDMVRMGTFLIGVFYLTQYVPDFLKSLPRVVMLFAPNTPPPGFGDLFETAVRIFAILISLWLVFRFGHVARLFAWLREAGQVQAKPADETPKAE